MPIGRIKTPYYGQSQLATVEISLVQKSKGLTLSISGKVWNNKHTDITQGGQMQDEFREALHNTVNYASIDHKKPFFKSLKVSPNALRKLLDIWDTWHLNDMNAACEHQKKEQWGHKEIIFNKYQLKDEIWHKQLDLERKTKKELALNGKIEVTKEEQYLLNLPWTIEIGQDQLNEKENILNNYNLKGREKKTNGWIYPSDHPEGVLTKPCPICGYKYGTAWLHEKLPNDVVQFVKDFAKDYLNTED